MLDIEDASFLLILPAAMLWRFSNVVHPRGKLQP